MTKGGRSKTVIDKYKKVTITLHPETLRLLDAYATEKALKRSEAVALMVHKVTKGD